VARCSAGFRSSSGPDWVKTGCYRVTALPTALRPAADIAVRRRWMISPMRYAATLAGALAPTPSKGRRSSNLEIVACETLNVRAISLRGASRTRVRDPGPENNHLPVLQGASQGEERERAGEMSHALSVPRSAKVWQGTEHSAVCLP